jgi:anti-sigma factor RsiW
MACAFFNKAGPYLDCELPPAERDTFELHVKGCSECAQEMQRLQRMSQFFVAAGVPEMNIQKIWSPRRSNQGLLRLAEVMMAAAAVIIVICTVGLIRNDTRRSETAAVPTWERLAVSQQIDTTPTSEIEDPMVQVLMRDQP